MSILVGPVTLSATGGITTSITGYKVHIFSTPGTSNFVPRGSGNIEVLVVGGGGQNSGWGGGGGGAVIYNKLVNVTSGTPYPITVGAVGIANTIGGISSCTFNNATIIAYGGGAGVYGGSGGIPSQYASGGGGGNSPGGTGAGITGLGFPGGNGTSNSSGGGGGAGSAGSNNGNGGIGIIYNITGISSYYGAGGGYGVISSIPNSTRPNGGLPGESYGTGGTPGAVIIRYPV